VDGDTSDLCLGVDIGGTKTRVGVVTAAHQVLDVRESPTPVRNGAQAVLEVVATLGRELRGRWTDVAACGVGTAGVVDPAVGTVVASTDALIGWTGAPVVHELTSLLGLGVHVDNDVNAFALGEAAGPQEDRRMSWPPWSVPASAAPSCCMDGCGAARTTTPARSATSRFQDSAIVHAPAAAVDTSRVSRRDRRWPRGTANSPGTP
jgi:hypothetical protein